MLLQESKNKLVCLWCKFLVLWKWQRCIPATCLPPEYVVFWQSKHFAIIPTLEVIIWSYFKAMLSAFSIWVSVSTALLIFPFCHLFTECMFSVFCLSVRKNTSLFSYTVWTLCILWWRFCEISAQLQRNFLILFT